jgi:hypothetical protein
VETEGLGGDGPLGGEGAAEEDSHVQEVGEALPLDLLETGEIQAVGASAHAIEAPPSPTQPATKSRRCP